jgi:hypothetical protein
MTSGLNSPHMNEIRNLNGRPSLIGCFSRWLFSRRIMRRILLIVALLMTVVAVIYARINWRGRKLWAEARREMAAKGEVLDWSAYLPQPVPDDQNIFKAPKMAEWFGDNRNILHAPLDQRVTNAFAARFFNTNSTREITIPADAAAYVAWSDQFQDDFDTIEAALKRPCARIASDYSRASSIIFPNTATLYAVVKTLTQRAKCHLILGQTDQAWKEATLLYELQRMSEPQGKFITSEIAWMGRELVRHRLQVIAKGMELRAWSEPQLAALQTQLGDCDVTARFADSLRCGRALLFSSVDNGDIFQSVFVDHGHGWTRTHVEGLLIWLSPRGNMYEAISKQVSGWQKMIDVLSLADGVIRPAEASEAFAQWKRAREGLPLLLRTQTLVNEGQIACALERYRLARGFYPPTLETLVPQFIEKLPRDIINGEPLIYRRVGDDFLLYSVGWNETDDGGKVVMGKGLMVNMTEGDWVWKSYMY